MLKNPNFLRKKAVSKFTARMNGKGKIFKNLNIAILKFVLATISKSEV